MCAIFAALPAQVIFIIAIITSNPYAIILTVHYYLYHSREWLTPNALQQSLAIQHQERDSDTSPL